MYLIFNFYIMKKIFLLLISIFILFSCSKDWGGKEVNNNWKSNSWVIKDQEIKTIYTSFYPIYFLTQSLIWKKVHVINLVPAGWEPHEYEPTLKQTAELQKSDLIILNWLGIESYEEKLRTSVWTGKIILLSEKLNNLIQFDTKKNDNEHGDENNWHNHWNIDPHTWLSPKVYKNLANILVIELEKAWYKDLDTTILLKLEELEKNYSLWMKDCEIKKLVTSHEAFWYLARDYWLIQYPVFGISPEEEPSAQDIAHVVDLIKKDTLHYIFSEAFVSRKFAETIKKETWIDILTLHPLESLSWDEEVAKEDYISIMSKNLEKLKIWLACK